MEIDDSKLTRMIRCEGREVHVGKLPGRKHAALYCVENNVVHPLAYFVSEEAESRFWSIVNGRAARGALDESEAGK